VDLPASFPWAPDRWERLQSVGPQLALQIGLPLASMVWARRQFRRPEWLLPALMWGCTLPLGVSALFKFGGRMNSMHSFVLWLPPVLTLVLTAPLPLARRAILRLGAALAVLAIGCGRVLATPRLQLRPQVAAYREAEQIAARFRSQVWFPFHPLVTLYSEGRYYHDEDGLYVRIRSQKPIPEDQIAAHLPPAMRVIALREGWSDWNIARRMLPPNARAVSMGEWQLWSAANNSSP
jgi:hypothetical protein